MLPAFEIEDMEGIPVMHASVQIDLSLSLSTPTSSFQNWHWQSALARGIIMGIVLYQLFILWREGDEYSNGVLAVVGII